MLVFLYKESLRDQFCQVGDVSPVVMGGGPSGLVIFTWCGVNEMERMDEIQMKVDTLLGFRSSLEGEEKEIFDMLMCYANEVAIAVDTEVRGC